jgi:hypothetical protein
MGIWVSLIECAEGGDCEGANRLLILGGLFLTFMVGCVILVAIRMLFEALTRRLRRSAPPPHRHRYKMGKCECGEVTGGAESFELPANDAYREWQDRYR